MNSVPPRGAERLLAFFAGPELEAEVLGDLQEQYARESYSKIWYWSQVFRSIPGFCSIFCSGCSRWMLARVCLLVVSGAVFVGLWELRVAQTFSWPMAKQLLAVSPFSAAETCKSMYLLLYGALMALLLLPGVFWRFIGGRSDRFLKLWALVAATLCSLPIVYYVFYPTRYGDTIVFRAEQLAIVWLCVAFVWLMGRFRGGWARGVVA